MRFENSTYETCIATSEQCMFGDKTYTFLFFHFHYQNTRGGTPNKFGGDAAEKRPRRGSENRGPLKDPNVDVHAWLANSVLCTHLERWWLRIDESAKLDRCATLANSFRGWVFTSFQFDRPLFSNLAQSEIMLLNAFISLYVVFPYESVDFVSRQP